MILRDLIDSGIQIEGHVKIQCWENDTDPTIYYEGDNLVYGSGDHMEREISYIFPYHTGTEVAICIELEQKED